MTYNTNTKQKSIWLLFKIDFASLLLRLSFIKLTLQRQFNRQGY
jgi:hypothetical protein